MQLSVKETLEAWQPLSTLVVVPQNEKEYDDLVSLLDTLIDEVGEDESHPLTSLIDVIGVLIERYENEHVPELSG